MTQPTPFFETSRAETLLSVENVSLSFGEHLVLRDINLKIDNLLRPGFVVGQVVAFLGASGVGKTQLLKLIAGLKIPNATITGSVWIGEKRAPAAPGMAGYVMQDNPLRRNRTVLGNLLLAARQRYNAKDALIRCNNLLVDFNLTEAAKKYPSELSGGMRQRVAICQQVLASDNLLLMDEPFAALDPVNVEKACGLIHKVADAEDRNTVILVTHDIRAAIAIADTLCVLANQSGKPGATIVREFDLVSAGLCWHPELTGTRLFLDMEQEVRSHFA